MTYKKVTPISKGVLRIRSEPDESGRVCGSVSYGEEVTVETTKVTSKKGKEYYRLAGYGYILASQVRDAESQTEAEAKVDAAVKKAESAASKAEQAAKACDGIAAGMNVMIDMGLFKHTDTYNYYIEYIKPKINVKKLKRIVSKHSRKENEQHDRLEKGDRNTAGTSGGNRQDIVSVNGLSA